MLADAAFNGGKANVDTGCTMTVAGQAWIDATQDKLRPFGLRATARKHHETFRGFGGARRESHY
eukprot:2403174-Lingulodinium_polyedra.AAC.1